MNLWINDRIPAPEGYFWCKSVNDVLYIIDHYENNIDFFNQDLLGFVQKCENEWGYNCNFVKDCIKLKELKKMKNKKRK